MKYLTKEIIKKFFHSLGLDIRRLSPSSNHILQLLKSCESFDIDMIFDIGANKGQFASELRSMGFKGKIVSFEPLASEHLQLTKVAHNDPLWTVHERTAIGDVDGQIEINISGNSVSSSILPMLNSHSDVSKKSKYIGKISAPIHRLDTVIDGYLENKNKYFIKIDTQGFEWQVLDGAEKSLKNSIGILCELSLVPLYEGQHLWLDMIKRIESLGFTLWALQPGFTDSFNGKTLQLDAIFFKEKMINQ